jgi:HSP20 family molecular chaperone IbpA
METDHETLRHVLRAGPSALARALGDPTIIRALRDPESPRPWPLPIDEQTHEPSFDVFDEGNEILIVSELPGVGAEQLHIYGYAAQVVVHVRGRGSRYSVRLPLRIDPTSVSYAFRNSILAIRANLTAIAPAE